MMTDNEIIKALNTAADKDFVKVYFWSDKPPKAATISVADIADLINRQQAEIERLKAGINVTSKVTHQNMIAKSKPKPSKRLRRWRLKQK